MQSIRINDCRAQGQRSHLHELHRPGLYQGLQELQGADIQKKGLGKRRRGETEFEAIPNPWPRPRGSDFGARSPTRFMGERLLGVSQRAARGPFTEWRTGAGGRSYFFLRLFQRWYRS